MAWAFVQSAKGTGTGVSTLAVAYSTANVSSGNKLIAHAVQAASAQNLTSVKDGAGNTFTAAANFNGSTGGNYGGGLFFIDVPAGDAGTKPTITLTIATAGDCALIVEEWSGLATGNTTAAAVDGTAATVEEIPAASQAQPAYTSHAANELLFSVLGDNGNSVTWTAPYANTDANNVQGSANDDLVVSWKNSTNGAETGTWTTSGTPTGSGLIVVAFQLAAAAAATAGPAAAVPGLVWERRFHHPQQLLTAAPAAAPSVNANAGLATGTGAALSPVVEIDASSTTVATGTGAALSPVPSVGANAGLATGTGAALSPIVSIGANAGLATGTGAALSPAAEVDAAATTVATATGAALSPVPSVGANAGLATGTGSALSTSVEIDVGAAVATGTGSALSPVASVPGGSIPATALPGQTWERQFKHRQQLLVIPSAAPSVNASAGLATGTGAALSPVVEIDASGTTAAAGTGAALNPAVSAGANPGLATGAGAAQPAIPSVTAAAGLATGTGAALAAVQAAAAGLATGTGGASLPALTIAANAVAARALGAALNASTHVTGAFTLGRLTTETASLATLGAATAPGAVSGGVVTNADKRTGGPG